MSVESSDADIEAGGLVPRTMYGSVETRETFQATGLSNIQVRVK